MFRTRQTRAGQFRLARGHGLLSCLAASPDVSAADPIGAHGPQLEHTLVVFAVVVELDISTVMAGGVQQFHIRMAHFHIAHDLRSYPVCPLYLCQAVVQFAVSPFFCGHVRRLLPRDGPLLVGCVD